MSNDVIDRQAIAVGAITGLVLIAVISVLRAFVDSRVDDFDDSIWIAVFAVAQLVVYVFAGAVAGAQAPTAPLTNGGLASLAAVVAWIPIRILVWAVRDENRDLFSGDDPVFGVGPVLVALVLAFALGLVGGAVGGRARARSRGG